MYCSFKACPWKALMILLCSIENGLNDSIEIKEKYNGFMILTAYAGVHRSNKVNEFNVIEGYEKSEELRENHYIPRNNLAGVKIIVKASVYKNPQ
jgi:hypothetical protein